MTWLSVTRVDVETVNQTEGVRDRVRRMIWGKSATISAFTTRT